MYRVLSASPGQSPVGRPEGRGRVRALLLGVEERLVISCGRRYGGLPPAIPYKAFPALFIYPRIVVGGAEAGEAVALGESAAVSRHVIGDDTHAGLGCIGLYSGLQQLAGEAHPAELASEVPQPRRNPGTETE